MAPEQILLEQLAAALALPAFDVQAAQRAMAPLPRGFPAHHDEPPREAGVLILLFPMPTGALHFVLTRRTEQLRKHSGQISFPGGRRDEDDADLTATALREAHEEIGVHLAELRLLGQLTRTYIPPSHYNVTPSVAYLPHVPQFTPNPDEVAEVFTPPLADLLDPARKQHELRLIQGFPVHTPFYFLGGYKVWGATAIMLSELEQRLRAAGMRL